MDHTHVDISNVRTTNVQQKVIPLHFTSHWWEMMVPTRERPRSRCHHCVLVCTHHLRVCSAGNVRKALAGTNHSNAETRCWRGTNIHPSPRAPAALRGLSYPSLDWAQRAALSECPFPLLTWIMNHFPPSWQLTSSHHIIKFSSERFVWAPVWSTGYIPISCISTILCSWKSTLAYVSETRRNPFTFLVIVRAAAFSFACLRALVHSLTTTHSQGSTDRENLSKHQTRKDEWRKESVRYGNLYLKYLR